MTDYLIIEAPDYPENWRSLAIRRAVCLSLAQADGQGIKDLGTELPFGGQAMVERPRALFAAFIMEPRIGHTGLRPLGCLYPQDIQGLSLTASPQGGWLALCAARCLAEAPRVAESFDWRRLGRELTQLGIDPWLIDPELIALKIADGAFSLNGLKPDGLACLSIIDQRLDRPGETWTQASPFAPSLQALSGRICLTQRPGLHRLFSEGRCLSVSITQGGSFVYCILDQ